jgi:hypothetical protein
MSYKNRKFTDLTNGKVFEVIDQFEDIAILNDKSKIKVNRLLDKNYYDEYIDPNDFFKNQSLLNTFADKIRQLPQDAVYRADNLPRESSMISENRAPVTDLNNIPSSTVVRPAFNESAILPYDQEEEKMELMRKAKLMYSDVSLDENIRRQNESFRNMLADDNPNIPVIQPFRPKQDIPLNDRKVNDVDEIQRVEVSRDDRGDVVSSVVYNGYNTPKIKDPMTEMFQNVKRNTKFSIELKIDNKIPRIDFIEMMEDSYSTSIIDFLAEEFTNNLLSDPASIKQMIKSKIESMVYPNGRGDEELETKEKPKRSPRKRVEKVIEEK